MTNTVVGYKRIQFHNHQNLGYEELSPALSKTFETEGLWIDLPTDVSTLFRKYMPQKEGMARVSGKTISTAWGTRCSPRSGWRP